MKNTRNNKMATLIALFLTLTFTASLIAVLPTANAAVTYTYTHVYVGASPNVIGVAQQLLLVAWTDNIPPEIGEQTGAISSPSGRQGWYNLQINVTKPDNNTETLTIPYSDPVGGGYLSYVPDMVGTYYIQAIFPETWKNTTANQAWYSAAVSPKVAFTVQQEPVALTWSETPLPTGYWTRPINTANHDWYALASGWLGGAHEQPAGAAGGTTSNLVSGKGPESAHILWTKQYYVGGLMDEQYGAIGYQTQHYQGMGFSGLILNGIVHFTPRSTAHGNAGWESIDLYTGETLYRNYSDTRPSFGQIYNYESGNQHGGFAYLYRTSGVTLPQVVQVPRVIQIDPGNMSVIRRAASTTINRTATPYAINSTGTVWEMIDSYTMQTICYIANVSSGGTAVYGKDGSILRYSTTNLGTTAAPNYRLRVWNSSAGTMPSSQIGTGNWQWRPAGGTFGGSDAYLGGLAYNYVHDGNVFWTLNVSIPSILGPRNSVLNETGSILAVREGEYVIFGTGGRNDERGIAPGWLMAVSLKRGQEGSKLWETTITPPLASVARNETISLTGVYPEDGVVAYERTKTLERWGYDMETGSLLWASEPEALFNYYGMTENVYNGILYSFGYSGQIRAYNITTGEVLWIYNCATVGLESAYGGNYPEGIAAVCDGKLYLTNGEHSPTQPLMRGPNLRCINAATGEEIWKILGYWGGMSPTSYNSIMADGIFVGLNYMDMQLYAFGKGNSATTVSAPQIVPTLGSSVMITGTVTDDTPNAGKRNHNGDFDFTLKGTPAISDQDMEAWMEYLFMQQAMPTDAKGVEVTLDTIDPNGNFIHIGTVTTDMTGAYGVKFTPEVPGTYQIIATFAGSKSYGPSYAQTYLGVDEAPPATAPPEYPQPIDPTMTIIGVGIAIAIAVIVAVAVATLLILRKK